MKNILLVLIISLLTYSCESQIEHKLKENNKFKFEYLKASNGKIEKEDKLKLKFYFNHFNLFTINKYLTDSVVFNDHISSMARTLQGHSDYVPTRMKRKIIKDKYGYEKFVLDSTFYENFEIENLIYIAEQHYDKVDNLRQARLKYDENINSVIEFKYNRKQPIQFYGNTIKLNIYFGNASSKGIKSFKGNIFIVNNELDILLSTEMNSDLLPKNVLPDPLYTSELESWNNLIINTYNSDVNDLRMELSDYTKSKLQRNYDNLNIIFIPQEISFYDGTIMFQ